MEKTTEIQNKKNPVASLSDIKQQVKEGKGFFSVCRENRKQRKLSPARRSINDLECALKLLGKPIKDDFRKNEKSIYWKRFVRLFESESEMPDKRRYQCEKRKDLRKKFHDLIDLDTDFPKAEITPGINVNTNISQKSTLNEPEDVDQQKFLLFNYLIAQGLSPEEARQEIENLLFETN